MLLALKSGQLAADAVAKGWPRAIPLRLSSANGERISTRAWTACAGWCANSTTASASAASSSKYPDLKGHLTDLLIGDLFKDSVDDVIEPMESTKENGAYVYAAMPE